MFKFLSVSTEEKKTFVVAEYSTRQIGSTKWWKELEKNLCERQNKLVLDTLEKIDCAKKPDDNGNNLLHYAARADNEIVARHLVKIGCDVNVKNKAGVPPVAMAVAYDSHKVLKVLLNAGAIYKIDHFVYNFGLAHIAAYATAHRCINTLLSFGIEFSDVDRDGWTPLHVAMDFAQCRMNHRNIDFVKKLINSGAFSLSKINARCQSGRTALDHASVYGYCSGITQLLNTRVCTEKIITDSLYCAIHSNKFEAACLLVKSGVDMNQLERQSGHNYTFLEHACILGFYKIKNLIDSTKEWPNYATVRKLKDLWDQQFETAKLLIEAGADVKLRTGPLSNLDYACDSLNFSLIKLLLDNGASVDKSETNLINLIVQSSVMQSKVTQIRNRYFKYNLNHDDIIELSRSRELVVVQLECIKLLIANGVRLHKMSPNLLVRRAVLYCHSEVVRLLLNSGAVLDLGSCLGFYSSMKSFHRIRPQAWYEVVKHVAKMQDRRGAPLNFQVDQLPEDLRKCYGKCRIEIEFMKKVLCWSEGTVTFYHLLIARDVTGLARNPSISSAIKRPDVMKRFPIYGNELLDRFDEAKKREKLEYGAAIAFCRLVRIGDNPIIMDRVFTYLHDLDLESLSMA